MTTHTITLIPGDGIGPEIAESTRKIIDATGLKINWEVCEAGEAVFKKGIGTGVPQETIESLERNKIAIKGPLSTPVGYGEKSANVTLRKLFETYGNIRPVKEFAGVQTPYSGRNLDLVIVRENLEDLYAGIEYMQTPGVSECLKLISRKGSEKVIRLAFEFARSQNRKTVTCASKANIMKLSEGLFKRTFEAVASEYPDIQAHHVIVDNAAHQLVKKPEQFDVLVMTNMNGDILSDLSSALVGGLGFAPGANIGDKYAIFEAVHGTAPKYAGTNTINPTALILSGVMMLRHIGAIEEANLIEEAIAYTLGTDRYFTRDICPSSMTSKTTSEYTDRIIENFGKKTEHFQAREHKLIQLPKVSTRPDFVTAKERSVVGFDLFVETAKSPKEVGQFFETLLEQTSFKLSCISTRGVKVYPALKDLEDGADMLTVRIMNKDTSVSALDQDITNILLQLGSGISWTHVEKLNVFDGVLGYTKVHGEN